MSDKNNSFSFHQSHDAMLENVLADLHIYSRKWVVEEHDVAVAAKRKYNISKVVIISNNQI